MAKFRKKPVMIEAVQFNVPADLNNFLRGVYKISRDAVEIHTLEGVMTASVGDWIIQGIKGEFYPCKPDIFEATYELAEE